MKFLFHTVTLGQTGGARVILNLSKILVDRGHDVTIIIDRNKVDYELPVGVCVKYLSAFGLKPVQDFKVGGLSSQNGMTLNSVENALKPRVRFLSLAFKWFKYFLKLLVVYPFKFILIRRFLRRYKPDLVASHNMYQELEHFWFYRGGNFYLVLHNSPNEVYTERPMFSFMPIKNYLSGVETIAVSEDASLELDLLFGGVIGKRHVIYNPFDFDLIRAKAAKNLPRGVPEDFFLVVAALSPRKRIDRLIKAIQKVDSNIELVILGEGVDEGSLKRLAHDLGVVDKVHFQGFSENPYAYISKAKALLLSSDSEGLPTVLIESLVCGTPIVSTNCPTGPREILRGDLRRFLVELGSEEEIVSGLAARMSEVVSEAVDMSSGDINRFEKEMVAIEWEKLARVGA